MVKWSGGKWSGGQESSGYCSFQEDPDNFKPHEIANLLWAFSMLGVHNPSLVAMLATHIDVSLQDNDFVASLTWQNAVSLAWGLVASGASGDTTTAHLIALAINEDHPEPGYTPARCLLHQVCFELVARLGYPYCLAQTSYLPAGI